MKIDKLRIILTQENVIWIAQSLEVDICVQGKDIRGALAEFAKRIIAIIHICRHENIEPFTNGPAPVYFHNLYENAIELCCDFKELGIEYHESLPKITVRVA